MPWRNSGTYAHVGISRDPISRRPRLLSLLKLEFLKSKSMTACLFVNLIIGFLEFRFNISTPPT